MYRITAINNEPDTDEEDCTKVTQEAEETILMSEYMRALKLQKDNYIDDALSLFNELLQTEILFEVTKAHTSKTLITVKYNCYKNIAFIHNTQKKNDRALEFLLKAIELDDTDVYTVNKLGQIALSLRQLDVAQVAFEKCLKKNPTYWPAGDGILQILCLREMYNEAYGWALKWYDLNPKYKRALDVISEIRHKFRVCGLDYIENSWSVRFKDKPLEQRSDFSVFPDPKFEEKVEEIKPNIDDFKIRSFEELDWLSFGFMIKKLYNYLSNIENGSALTTVFKYGDLLLEDIQTEAIEGGVVKEETTIEHQDGDTDTKAENETDNDIPMDEKLDNSNLDIASKCAGPNTESANSVDGSTEDSDAPTTGDDTKPAAKPKSRRRGSDLKLLDPWFYWKNRKYSQRQKNKQLERMEIDTTVNGLLRKILEKYYEDNFDDESPFHPDTSSTTDRSTATGCDSDSKPQTIEDFQEETKESFIQMINEIKKKSFNVITLVGKWVQHISKLWESNIPNEILTLYLKLFRKYLKHHSLSSWNLLDESGIEEVFRMAIFYLELSHERTLRTAEPNTKNEVDEYWLMLFNHIVINSGLHEFNVTEEIAFKYQMRLSWLQYCLARYEYDLRRSVNCLKTIRSLIVSNNESFILHLPNQTNNNRIDMQTTSETITMLERMINLNDVHQLYADQQYKELIAILTDSLMNVTKSKNIDNLVLKLNEQFEVILECFWNMQMVEECLIWCERCLKYALDRFVEAPVVQSTSYTDWAKCINFILSYIEAIIMDESYFIVNCLGRYYARLIQSIVRIISNQLDADEKNNNQVHPINLKTPWIILHHILQREEDMKSVTKRKLSSDSRSSNEIAASEEDATDTEEDLIPKSISIFFTAHEYLGNRTWCTKDNGDLLMYIIDTIIPRLRTPYLEHCRNEVIEYLEQITYCLFRFPAKRARLKHLEKHESQHIELSWNYAVQLYDLYRPIKMPEFDMFKRDSITTEMEQLLQRIITIIPAEIDPSTRCEPMEKFIAGEIDELPKALDILPYHINSIYFLLADYYFKNKEFAKALKYYIADLSNQPSRFDAWAGLALSKAHLMGTDLNLCSIVSTKEWIQHSEEVLRCFEQCLKIDEQQHVLWIEYGNYAYALHSYCSRCMKQSSNDCVLLEHFDFLKQKKEQCLKITNDCFLKVDNMKPVATDDDPEGSDDEKWLYHYMLGKVAEKRKQPPNIVIEHYLRSADALYENNATYPFKISSVNPQNLALEALEIFYRITATIIKYMEDHPVVTYGIGKFFMKILNQQAKSPFALSQAKINENILNAHLQRKRKLTMTNEEANKQKMVKADLPPPNAAKTTPNIYEPKETDSSVLISVQTEPKDTEPTQTNEQPTDTEKSPVNSTNRDAKNADDEMMEPEKTNAEDFDKNNPLNEASQTEKSEVNAFEENADSPLRRGSQESTATTTTQTTTSTSTDSTSSSSESSSSSDSSSDTDSTSEDDTNKDENAPLDEKRIYSIYEMCIKNLEECITRYPEHYKSIYRLAVIFMNGPEKIKNIKKCNQLLLGTYTTVLGNQVQGLFTDRKNNNLFNGFWRNKSSEIERPGSFSSHLSKCVNILMQILKMNSDYKFLMEIIFAMQRVPDADKRYIKDSERKDLLEMATAYCVQSFKDLLRKHSIEQRNDNELLSLIIEIFKALKKMKNVSLKESPFSGVLVDTYKAYAEGKVWLQENVNYLESANKFCVSLTNSLKNQEKQQQLTGQRQTLEELGMKNLAPSLSKASAVMAAGVSPMAAQPTSSAALMTPPQPVPVSAVVASVIGGSQIRTVPPVISLESSAVVTTISTLTPSTAPPPTMSTSTAPATNVHAQSMAPANATNPTNPMTTSRPRGRPPGSKNQTSKAAEKNAALQQQKMMASMLQPTGALPNLEMIAKLLDPTVSSIVMALLAEPNFMKTLSMFPDQNSRTTLLREYFTISKYPNTQQLIDGFNTVYNCLVVALQQQTSAASLMQSTLKQMPKVDKAFNVSATGSATAPTATITATSTPNQVSSMSIFPTASKPHQSLINTSPSKPATISPSIPASITPIPSSNQSSTSLLKPSVSNVISIGSFAGGQLTITPSVSITPNPTKSTSSLPMPSPNFGMPSTAQPKASARRSAGEKSAKQRISKAQRLSQGPFSDLPQIKVENLPKSLSIIPSPSGQYMPPIKPTAPSPINIDLTTKKPAKQTKAKKRSLDANMKFGASTPQPSKLPKMDASLYSKSMAMSQQLQAQLNASMPASSASAMNQLSFLSHYEQFLTGAPQNTLAIPKPTKTKTNAAVSKQSQQQKPAGGTSGTIKVKQLEQLQGRQSLNVNDKQTPKAKQGYPTQNVGGNMKTTISGGSAVLNAYSTTISSISSNPSVPNTYSPISMAATNHPATVQISPTKTLQQKLAERQRQFSDVNTQSRPSSTSSAGSSKTRKSDTEVIVLD